MIVFNELTQEEVTEIVDLLIKRVQSTSWRARASAWSSPPTPSCCSPAKGYDPSLGARPLRRAIQRMIEDPLSEKILWKEFHAGETIVVDALDDEIVFRAIEGIEPPPVELAGSGSEG